eukprot:scaffold102856_cov57-Cyclotella_meneghiniana.AAC.3
MGKLLGSSTQKAEDVNSSSNNNELPTESNHFQTNHARKRTSDNSNNPQQSLSASLVTSVNFAAETARIVLDQSANNNHSEQLPITHGVPQQ